MNVLQIVLKSNDAITLFVAFIANLIVIYFCFKIHLIEINRNRWVIALPAFVQIIEAVVSFFLETGLHATDKTVVYIILGVARLLPIALAGVIFVTFTFLFMLRVFTLPIIFLYRYALICRKKRLAEMFTFWSTVLMVSIMAIAAALPAVCNYLVFEFEKTTFLSGQFAGVPLIQISPPRKQGVLMGISFLYSTLLILASYISVFLMSGSIYATLRTAAIASKTKALQKELTTMMILQSIIPLIFTTIPVGIFIVTFMMHISITDYASIAFTLQHWQPCINPLLLLYFIKPFRLRIIRQFTGEVPTTAAGLTVLTNTPNVAFNSKQPGTMVIKVWHTTAADPIVSNMNMRSVQKR